MQRGGGTDAATPPGGGPDWRQGPPTRAARLSPGPHFLFTGLSDLARPAQAPTPAPLFPGGRFREKADSPPGGGREWTPHVAPEPPPHASGAARTEFRACGLHQRFTGPAWVSFRGFQGSRRRLPLGTTIRESMETVTGGAPLLGTPGGRQRQDYDGEPPSSRHTHRASRGLDGRLSGKRGGVRVGRPQAEGADSRATEPRPRETARAPAAVT